LLSDYSQGPGWWQASDGKWYPPEQAPGYQTPPPGGASPGGAYGQPYGGAPQSVDVGSALSYGWNKFIANIGDIIIIWLIVIAVTVVFNMLSRGTSSIMLSLALSVVGWIASMIAQVGLIRVGLLITRGEKVTPAAAFNTAQIGPYIVASILYGIATFIGLLAFCVGAIVVGFLLYFYGYYVLDRGDDAVTSLKSSFELTSKNFGTVGLFALVAIVLSVCTCGLASPIIQIGAAYIYRNLNGQPVAP
jgi:uncharacterized membrane protein